MAVFRFHLIGAGKHVDLEVAAPTIGDLNKELGTHINVSDGADNGAMRAWAASMPA